MSKNRVTERMPKRSVTVDGRKTSFSIEEQFWIRLKAIAESGGRTVSNLVSIIRAQYPGHNLSSACRLYVLADAVGDRPQ